MGKLSKLKTSGRKIEISDLRGLSTRDILEDAKIILEQPEIPDEVLSVLSFHEDASVRLALAQRTNNPEEILRRLAIDDDSKIGKTAKKHLRKKETIFEKILHLLGYLFSSFKKLVFVAVALAAIFYALSWFRTGLRETRKTVATVKNITQEQQAYMACTLALKAANPKTEDLSSCDPYLKAHDIKQKKVDTVEYTGECPVGYKVSRDLQVPVCVAEKTTK